MTPPRNLRSPPEVYRYRLADWEVWAGRTSRDNDQLSLKTAKANDWWFHVKGQPGSHVVLFLGEAGEPPRDIVKQAAAIAAWHSKLRGGGVVPVSATRAKEVSKPRGAKAGTVTIRKEVILKVRPAIPDGAL